MQKISVISVLAGVGTLVLSGALTALCIGALFRILHASPLSDSLVAPQIGIVVFISMTAAAFVTARYAPRAKPINVSILGVTAAVIFGFGSSAPAYVQSWGLVFASLALGGSAAGAFIEAVVSRRAYRPKGRQ